MFKSATLILLLFALLLLFIIPYTRQEMKSISGQTFVLVAKYFISFVKILWSDHYLIVKNLVSPRRLIYPTLESDDQVNQNV